MDAFARAVSGNSGYRREKYGGDPVNFALRGSIVDILSIRPRISTRLIDTEADSIPSRV